MVGQGAACDAVVQAARELLAAQSLQQVPAGLGQDMAAGELPADGEDDRGDIDGGERGVHHRVHPGADRRPRRTAALKEPVDHLPAEPPERGSPPPREQLLQRARGLLRRAGVLRRLPPQTVPGLLTGQPPVFLRVGVGEALHDVLDPPAAGGQAHPQSGRARLLGAGGSGFVLSDGHAASVEERYRAATARGGRSYGWGARPDGRWRADERVPVLWVAG
ncbi:hypothetical protein ACFXAZ_36840, partial [Streptomyces sp. NPDC059477]|uniref:hypothetical protein n=1 Tax=Streptomyces sp. NPDC059477 TaxID=3346847 RepID=UPI0036CD4E11